MVEPLTEEDWLLVIEALAYYGGDPRDFDDYRKRHAWDLIDYFTAQQDIDACARIREEQYHHPYPHE